MSQEKAMQAVELISSSQGAFLEVVRERKKERRNRKKQANNKQTQTKRNPKLH